MYRVMLVDDEKIVTDAIEYIIKKNFSDIQVISTARSGRGAIEAIEYSVPDIIFMDIKMPGLNGIETIREIKKRYKHVVFIVLTAFDQFDFAKEALNLGVIEYLLKPVNRTKVVEAINKAVDIIKAEKEKRRQELELKEKLETVIPILEHGFIYSIIFFDEHQKELFDYQRILEIQQKGGYIMTVEFGDEENDGSLKNRIGYSVRSERFYSFFRDTVKALHKSIVGPVMLNRIVIFVPTDVDTDELSRRTEAIKLAETLLQRLSRQLNCSFKIGIGQSYEGIEFLSTSYEESLKALRYLQGSGVMHFMDMPSGSTHVRGYPEHKEKLMLQKVSAGDSVESVEAFRHIFHWLVNEYSGQPLKIKNKLLELLFLTNGIAWENGLNTENEGIRFLEDIMAIDDMNELKLYCSKYIEKTAAQINANRSSKSGGLIAKAKEYIKTNYGKPITLEDLSMELNLSPQYFSKLFKEETGENFIDYLTGIRIKIAKDLLKRDDLSIKEICYQIGYNDPNYFSRIFKKIVGVTPTEYRENLHQ